MLFALASCLLAFAVFRNIEGVTCKGPRVPKVVLIMVDGARWDYPDQDNLPGFRKLAEKGARAPHVTPIFPSNSYPNWYSLVTGLYAESHGFVQNMMYDPKHKDFFLMGPNETASVPHWWNEAEPLWITAEKNGLRTALYWWDGCQVEIRGRKSTFCEKYQYVVSRPDANEETKEALHTALELLANEEIQLAQVYYEMVDFNGHKYGPDSNERRQAMKHADELIDVTLTEIDKRGLQDEINVVIISDHGMTETDPRSVTTINLAQLLDVSDIRYMIYYGANSMLLPYEGKTEKIYQALQGVPGLHVYHKEDIPENYHLKNSYLVLPLLLVADQNYMIQGLDIPGKSIPTGSSFSLGSHGYDPYKMADMRGIFFATGPGIRKNYVTPPLSNVDIYNVLCDLLGMEPLPNNGTKSLTRGMMVADELNPTPCHQSNAVALSPAIYLCAFVVTSLNSLYLKSFLT